MFHEAEITVWCLATINGHGLLQIDVSFYSAKLLKSFTDAPAA